MHKATAKAAGLGVAAMAVAGVLALSGCGGAATYKLSVTTHNGEATATLSGATESSSHGTLLAKNGQVLEISYDLSSGSATVELLNNGSVLETFEDLSGQGTKTSQALPKGNITFRVTGHNDARGTMNAKISGEETSEVIPDGSYQMAEGATPTYMTLDENGTTITDENGNPIETEGAEAQGEGANDTGAQTNTNAPS